MTIPICLFSFNKSAHDMPKIFGLGLGATHLQNSRLVGLKNIQKSVIKTELDFAMKHILIMYMMYKLNYMKVPCKYDARLSPATRSIGSAYCADKSSATPKCKCQGFRTSGRGIEGTQNKYHGYHMVPYVTMFHRITLFLKSGPSSMGSVVYYCILIKLRQHFAVGRHVLSSMLSNCLNSFLNSNVKTGCFWWFDRMDETWWNHTKL